MLGAWDQNLLRVIYGLPESWQPFFWFWSECLKLKPFLVVVCGIAVVLMAIPKTRWQTAAALLAVGLTNEITDLVKATWPAQRPNVVMEGILARSADLQSSGTISAHSANMACLASALGFMLGWRWGLFWGVIAFLVGFSRIYNGVHFPSQVLLGWGTGITLGYGASRAYKTVLNRRIRPEAARSDQDDPSTPSESPQS